MKLSKRAWKVALGLNGLLDNISKFYWAPEETKAALKKEFCEKTLPLKFSQLERRLCQNGGEHFAGESLTYADLMLVVLNDNLRLCIIIKGYQMSPVKNAFFSFQV